MIKDRIYHKRMVSKQIKTLEDLVINKTYYVLGANYCPFDYTDPKNGFDCASSAMYGIESAVKKELLCGNQNVIEDEAKKEEGIFYYVASPEPGDLVIVNYPENSPYDMGAYKYNDIYYPDPADHVFTVGFAGVTIDTGYDDNKATVIKFGDLNSSISFYQSLGARLVYVRPNYPKIKDKYSIKN